MRIEKRRGKKTEFGQDFKIHIWADGEAITFNDILKILKELFENEDRIYPTKMGFKGRAMLVDAIYDLAHGMSIDDIAEKYKFGAQQSKLG